MNEDCLRYAEDPDANAAHLANCQSCRAAYGAVETHAIAVDALPLAPWEGASYRAWPLVLGGALAVLAVALALCASAGISPIAAVIAGMSGGPLRTWIGVATETLRGASPIWQVAYGVAFVAINTIFVVLLRRAPRGIDA